MSPMSVFYQVSYRLGFHPWEDLAEHPPFAGRLLSLVAGEERGADPPYGRALDLGCGSAVWGVRLAQRGWQVTGVDNVGRALARAQERIRAAGVPMTLVRGDATRLRESGIGSGYRLVLDTGTFHGLDRDDRLALGREVDAVASPDATVLLDCFAPAHRGPLPHGCTRADVEEAFPAWEITGTVSADSAPDPLARALRFDEVFHRLRRVRGPAAPST